MDEQALVLGMVVSFSKQYSSQHLSKLETSHDTRWKCASCQHGGGYKNTRIRTWLAHSSFDTQVLIYSNYMLFLWSLSRMFLKQWGTSAYLRTIKMFQQKRLSKMGVQSFEDNIVKANIKSDFFYYKHLFVHSTCFWKKIWTFYTFIGKQQFKN